MDRLRAAALCVALVGAGCGTSVHEEAPGLRDSDLSFRTLPEPIAATWWPNRPKYPHPYVPGFHLMGQWDLVVTNRGSRGATVMVVAAHVPGTGTGFDHPEVRVPPRTTAVILLGSILGLSSVDRWVTMEVQLVDDDGGEHVLFRRVEVVAPPYPSD